MLRCSLVIVALLTCASVLAGDRLAAIPDSPALQGASPRYLAAFEVRDDAFVAKRVTDAKAAKLGLQCWARIKALFPLSYRKLLVQFNIMDGRRLAGAFSGDGSNDVGRPGYRLSVAAYCAAEEKKLARARRAVTRRRGTLDWTLVHEMGHYICLRMNVIELFSQSFDGDAAPRPTRRKKPKGYPRDGSPKLDGDFVTSYAERVGGDEEAVETFTTYMLVKELPKNDSLAARKIRFFETIPGFPELRRRLQGLGGREPGPGR